MLDRDRILARIDQLQLYLRELRTIVPPSFDAYQTIATRRACERLLQLAIESVTDICGLLVTGLRLGLPAEERDVFEKLHEAGLLSSTMTETLKRMRGFRNILVHEYTRVDDSIVYHAASTRLGEASGRLRPSAGGAWRVQRLGKRTSLGGMNIVREPEPCTRSVPGAYEGLLAFF